MPAVQTAGSPTFESVWAGLQEVNRTLDRLAQRQEEYDKRQEEYDKRQEAYDKRQEVYDKWQEEYNKRQEEYNKQREEDDKRWKEAKEDFNRRLGKLTNLFGDITEAEMAPQLCDKFRKFGLNFPRANPNVYVNDRDNEIYLEIDIMLENGDKAMVVEVKTKLTTERIDKHIERMEKMRRYADLRGDKRTFLGAVAGIIVTDEVRKYALDQGFYLIEPSGESFTITPPNEGPKEY